MYDLSDTIVAVSSPTSDERVVVRFTGPRTIETCGQILGSLISARVEKQRSSLIEVSVKIDDELEVEAQLYLFLSPHSYTGDDVAEIHIHTNTAVTEALIGNLLGRGLRMAGPGEFTARAYLNGKIDLAQAEAVNEIIVSSNAFQLAAAEELLSGRLSETTAKVRSTIMDCLSLIEAGLDFSGEDIELETGAEVIERLLGVKEQLEQLLSGSIRYGSLIDLPAVGIAGAPNAGKSSLLNKLLGKERSIVSHERKTTRDVLTALCTLAHCRCVLFDCAGLVRWADPVRDSMGKVSKGADNVLDELAQQAAIEALRNSAVVVFCVDISKADWSEDISILELTEPKIIIPVATKCDLVSEEVLSNRLAELNELFGLALKSTPTDRFSSNDNKTERGKADFGAGFLATSAETGTGLEILRERIDKEILDARYPSILRSRTTAKDEMLDAGSSVLEKRATSIEYQVSSVALTARHKQAVTEAIENVGESVSELKAGSDEVAAMMLRAAYRAICGIESATGGHVDEQILEQIFSRFCIGK